ncbi:Importin subunit alpha-6 [Toxocara canis]|uniref:Importin subunit alpha-6 n=1 Tax=Toxocara canis TaxID=6265 RepID=A0A0B2V5K4_TOXCA|nr:Importin subunit alpha-6 [Toxocara canis]
MSCEGLLPSHADALSPSAQREAMYKNKGMTSVEMRKRRETNTAQLRKQKRESEISKRRNIDQNPDSSVYDEDDSMSGPLEVFDGKNLTKLFSNDPSAQESAMRLFRRRLCADKGNAPVDEAVALGLVGRFVSLLSSSSTSVRRDAVSVLGSIVAGTPAHTQSVVHSGVVPTFVQLLSSDDDELRERSLLAIGNIACDHSAHRDLCLSLDVVPAILRILNSSAKPAEIRSAVWTLSNLCRGKSPPPDFSKKLLVTGKESIKKEVCWTLSNILAGNRKQIQTVIDAHILPSLIHVLASGDFKTRKEACWAIGNALSGGNAAQVATVVREGAILPLCDLLTVMEPKIVNVALNALDCILRHGENIKNKSKTGINPYCALVEEARGVEKLEFLQQSPNLEIYVKAFDIIENYFAGDEPEEDALAADEANGEAAKSVTTFSF